VQAARCGTRSHLRRFDSCDVDVTTCPRRTHKWDHDGVRGNLGRSGRMRGERGGVGVTCRRCGVMVSDGERAVQRTRPSSGRPQGGVVLVEGWLVDLAAWAGELVPQHDDLGVFAASGADCKDGRARDETTKNARHGAPGRRDVSPGQVTRPNIRPPQASATAETGCRTGVWLIPLQTINRRPRVTTPKPWSATASERRVSFPNGPGTTFEWKLASTGGWRRSCGVRSACGAPPRVL
jgi:hypothetical protein